MVRIFTLAALHVALLAWCDPTHAVVRTDLRRIAMTGDAAPVSAGDEVFFETFGVPMINNLGEVAFIARIENAEGDLVHDRGIWLAGAEGLQERVREGQVAPGTPLYAQFSAFRNETLNDRSEIGFYANTDQPDFPGGIWINSSDETLAIAIENTPVPGYDLHFDSIPPFRSMNNLGQVAFASQLESSGAGLFVGNTTTVVPVALPGDNAPGSSGVFRPSTFPAIPINDLKQTAFQTAIYDAESEADVSRAMYVGDSQSLLPIAEIGMLASGTDAIYGSFPGLELGLNINSYGETAFVGHLVGGSSTYEDGRGIWRSRDGATELVVRAGDVAKPDFASTKEVVFTGFATTFVVDTDQVIFLAGIIPSDISLGVQGSLWSVINGELTLLLQTGTPAPETHELLSELPIYGLTTNRLGQVAMQGKIGNASAIWAQDPAGVFRLIVQEGEMLELNPGNFREVAGISLGNNSSNGSDGRPRVINDAGQIVFHALFDDGSHGIFVSDAAGYLRTDLNRDGFVDGEDLGILLGNFNQAADPASGELNGTAPVDGLDLGRLLGAWNPPELVASSLVVPEPAVGWLCTLGITPLLGVRRSRSARRKTCDSVQIAVR